MKQTNEFGAPKPFVWATEGNSWKPAEDRLYVTQLFAPPMQRRLMIDHFDEIENDCIDFYYRILGTATHSMIEKAAEGRVGVQTEVRVAMPEDWFGIKITGRIDWIDYIDGILADIKTSSVGIFGRDIKDDWVYQANIYRYMMARLHGYKADKLRIYPLYRDWSPIKANGRDHPLSPYDDIDIPIWPLEKTEEFIKECVAQHTAEETRFCTDEERWKTPDCFAVKKKGAAKAIAATMVVDGNRIPIPTMAEARSIIEAKGLTGNADVFIEERKGGCRRCDGYCDCAAICKRVNADKWELE